MKRKALLVCFSILNLNQPCAALEKEVTLIDPLGHATNLAIDSSDKFFDVIENLEKYYAYSVSEESDGLTTGQSVELKMEVTNRTVMIRAQQIGRDYFRKVTSEEKKDIEYIITHMAYDDLKALWDIRTKMKQAGERIDHLHPLKFLETICTSEKTIAGVKGIYDRILLGQWVWEEFVDGCCNTLKEEHAKNNILPYLSDFAKKIKVDLKYLSPLAEKGKWSDFVKTIVQKVPRTMDADRYRDM